MKKRGVESEGKRENVRKSEVDNEETWGRN